MSEPTEDEDEPHMNFGWKFVDRQTGEEWQAVCTSVSGFSVDRDGTVTSYSQKAGEDRVEEAHHISEDPAVQSVFGDWLWDLALDPRAPGR
jgi:hypothetical protein